MTHTAHATKAGCHLPRTTSSEWGRLGRARFPATRGRGFPTSKSWHWGPEGLHPDVWEARRRIGGYLATSRGLGRRSSSWDARAGGERGEEKPTKSGRREELRARRFKAGGSKSQSRGLSRPQDDLRRAQSSGVQVRSSGPKTGSARRWPGRRRKE